MGGIDFIPYSKAGVEDFFNKKKLEEQRQTDKKGAKKQPKGQAAPNKEQAKGASKKEQK